MAISKTQPMRSAEIEILDKVNALDTLTAEHTNSINTLSGDLADEISDRELADMSLGQRIDLETSNRQSADTIIQGQIGTGFSSNHTIAQSLNAVNSSISDINTKIGNGFDSQNTITAYKNALDTFLGDRSQLDDTIVNTILGLANAAELFDAFSDRFKIGIIENITIPANDSVSTSHVFATPFESTDSGILLAQVITSELLSLFTYTLINCTYSGFSYSIANSDADAHTVALGYVAIKVN